MSDVIEDENISKEDEMELVLNQDSVDNNSQPEFENAGNLETKEAENIEISEIKNLPESTFFVRITGLPNISSTGQLGEFLGLDLTDGTCRFVRNIDKTENQEGFIILECEEKCRTVLSKHNCEIDGRSIEIYPTCKKVVLNALENSQNEGIIKVRAHKTEHCCLTKIKWLIEGNELEGDESSSIVICRDLSGKLTGEAYINLKTAEMATRVLGKTGNGKFSMKKSSYALMKGAFNLNRLRLVSYVRHKTISDRSRRSPKRSPKKSVKKSSRKYTRSSRRRTRSRSRSRHRGSGRHDGPYDERVPASSHSVRVFGLSSNVTENDISRFFAPIHVISVVIERRDDMKRQPSAVVFFHTHSDALQAAKRDRDLLGDRCARISLYSSTSPVAETKSASRWSQPASNVTYPFPVRSYTPYDHFNAPPRQTVPVSSYSSNPMPAPHYSPESLHRPNMNPYYNSQRSHAVPDSGRLYAEPTSAYKRYSTAPPESEVTRSDQYPYIPQNSGQIPPAYSTSRQPMEGYTYGYGGISRYSQPESYPKSVGQNTYGKRVEGNVDRQRSYGAQYASYDVNRANYPNGGFSSQARYNY